MFNQPFALELAHIAVEESIRLGASFADARFELKQVEELVVQNGALGRALTLAVQGIGVRVLVKGAWGFVAISEPTRHDVTVAVRRAVDQAKSAAILQEDVVKLVSSEPHRAIYRTQLRRDPLAVPVEEKLALLFGIDEKLRAADLIKWTSASFSAQRHRKIYVSSDGSEVDQELVWTGVGYQAGASDGHDFQTRSFGGQRSGVVQGKGWELVEELPLLEHTQHVVEEAVLLLKAAPCPAEATDLVLGGAQLAQQLRESCGRILELDRVLGYQRGLGGGSFLTVEELGNLEFGSKSVSVYADAREPGSAGTFGFDDEGVEAQRVDLVTQGRLTGFLSSRETAHRVGLERSQGAMRAASWSDLPTIRMTNVSLAPGNAGNLDAVIGDTKSGIFMESAREHSLGDGGSSFLSTGEIAWEIKNGRKARPLKNPLFTGRVVDFWRSCDAVCDASSWSSFGTGLHPKGQPLQLVAVGTGGAPARFRGVHVGSSGSPAPHVVRPLPAAGPAASAEKGSGKKAPTGKSGRRGGKKRRKRKRGGR